MKAKIISTIMLMYISLTSFSQLKVFSAGGVSIGGTSALPWPFILQVSGNSVFSANQNTISSAAMIRGLNAWSSATTPDFTWFNNDQTGFFHPATNVIGVTIGGSEKMRITNNGNLLIGQTSDPGTRLMVNAGNTSALTATVAHSGDYGQGVVLLTNKYLCKTIDAFCSQSGSLVETFVVWGNGDAWGKSWTSWSDKNLKENIDDLSGALDKIRKLKGVQYNFRSSFVGSQAATKKEIGLIAQDVELVVPEAVNTNEHGMKGIMYQNLIPLLIEAVKEQDKQISEMQNDLNHCCTKNSHASVASEGKNDLNINSEYKGNSYIKQNTPNPFSKETIIEYSIVEKDANSSIMLFDMNGKHLKTLSINRTGNGTVTISANDFQPGMYYYSLIINNMEIDTKRMILTQ